MDILITLGIGAAGGVLALVFEHVYLHFKEKHADAEKKVIKFSNEERRITGSVFTYLGPDAAVEMMKADLGPPNKQYGSDAGLFEIEMYEDDNPALDEQTEYVPEFTAYLYFFKNAHVKIISKDQVSIDAITVLAHDGDSSISIPNSETEFLNEYKIGQNFFEENSLVLADHFPGCRDVFTAICSQSIYPGISIATTYFCDDSSMNYDSVDLRNNPKTLIGATVYGVCISKGVENVSCIYSSECV